MVKSIFEVISRARTKGEDNDDNNNRLMPVGNKEIYAIVK